MTIEYEAAMGVGDSGCLFVYGSYEAIKAAQAIVLEKERLRREVERLCGLIDENAKRIIAGETLPLIPPLQPITVQVATLSAPELTSDTLVKQQQQQPAASSGDNNRER